MPSGNSSRPTPTSPIVGMRNRRRSGLVVGRCREAFPRTRALAPRHRGQVPASVFPARIAGSRPALRCQSRSAQPRSQRQVIGEPPEWALVGNGRAAGVRNVAGDHQALAPSAPSSCRSRARWLVMPRCRQGPARRFGAYLREKALQCLNAWGQRIPIGIYGVGQ